MNGKNKLDHLTAENLGDVTYIVFTESGLNGSTLNYSLSIMPPNVDLKYFKYKLTPILQ